MATEQQPQQVEGSVPLTDEAQDAKELMQQQLTRKMAVKMMQVSSGMIKSS